MNNSAALKSSLGESVTQPAATSASSQPVTDTSHRYLCVLDFEATCWKEGGRQDMEIIEFPSVLCRVEQGATGKPTLVIVDELQQYVRPVIVPELSDFCTELTGIRQEQVSTARPFPEAYQTHYQWLTSHIKPGDTVHIVTCGAWDLNTMLPQELRRYPDLDSYPVYMEYINIKEAFGKCYGTEKASGMAGMLRHLGLQLEGRHHSGIDDCRNIQRILAEIVSTGFTDWHVHQVGEVDQKVVKNQEMMKARRAEKLNRRNKPSSHG
jgi:ERI1 exoribonuclease 3